MNEDGFGSTALYTKALQKDQMLMPKRSEVREQPARTNQIAKKHLDYPKITSFFQIYEVSLTPNQPETKKQTKPTRLKRPAFARLGQAECQKITAAAEALLAAKVGRRCGVVERSGFFWC